nr:HAD family phosphatase [Streptomyces sp. KS 21]
MASSPHISPAVEPPHGDCAHAALKRLRRPARAAYERASRSTAGTLIHRSEVAVTVDEPPLPSLRAIHLGDPDGHRPDGSPSTESSPRSYPTVSASRRETGPRRRSSQQPAPPGSPTPTSSNRSPPPRRPRAAADQAPVAVVSANYSDVVRHGLAVLGLDDLPWTIIGRDHVPRPKPAPDAYLHAARLLGVAPTRCLAHEDSDEGVTAATSAGMNVVDIRHHHWH